MTHAVSGKANVAWFNPSSFSSPGTGIIGNTGRNQFRGPADFSDNISLFKSFPIKDRFNFEIRGDAFNATNTPEFANPVTH